MSNNFESIIDNLEEGENLVIGNHKKFSNEIVLNKYLQRSVIEELSFVNLTFKNIDFTGSFFCNTIFENCRFINVIFTESGFWSCTFSDCQMTESNFTQADLNSSTFKNCEFLNSNFTASSFMDFEFREVIFKKSNLNLILLTDVKVWKSDELIQIKDFSTFKKFLIATNSD